MFYCLLMWITFLSYVAQIENTTVVTGTLFLFRELDNVALVWIGLSTWDPEMSWANLRKQRLRGSLQIQTPHICSDLWSISSSIHLLGKFLYGMPLKKWISILCYKPPEMSFSGLGYHRWLRLKIKCQGCSQKTARLWHLLCFQRLLKSQGLYYSCLPCRCHISSSCCCCVFSCRLCVLICWSVALPGFDV